MLLNYSFIEYWRHDFAMFKKDSSVDFMCTMRSCNADRIIGTSDCFLIQYSLNTSWMWEVFLRYILTDLVIKHDFDLLDEKEARLDFFLTTNIFRESLPSFISINNAKKYPKCPSQTKRII